MNKIELNSRAKTYFVTCLVMALTLLVVYLTDSTWQEGYAILTTMCIVYITLRIK